MTVLTAAWSVQTGRGATLVWDPDGVGAVPLGGSGTWDTSSMVWDNGGTYQVWNNLVANIAQFGGDPGTVSLAEAITAQGLSFKSDYKLVSSLPANVLTLTAGTIRADTGTLAVIDSPISGSAGLTKSGGGSVRLTNTANSFTGTINIDNGILSIRDAAALGPDTSAININGSATRGIGGGALLLGGGYGTGVTLNRAVNVQGLGPIAGGGVSLISVGDNVITGALTSGTGTVNTAVSSSGGRLTLGNVAVTSGTTMTFGATNGQGVGSYAVTGALSGAGTIGKVGGGMLLLSPSDATGYSGVVQTSAGSIRVTDTAALGTSSATNAIDLNGGVFELRTDSTAFTSAKRVNLNNGGGNDLVVDHAPGSSVINQTVTFANFDYDVAETMVINTRNGYNVSFTAATAAGNQAGDTTVTNTGSGLVTYGGTLWGMTNTTARLLTVNGTGNTTLSGSITASGALHTFVKSGTGTATILGTASTYTGATTISGGPLVITDFRSLNAHSTGTNAAAINIGSGTTAGVLTIGTATAATAAGLTLLTGKAVNLNGTTGGATINANQTFAAPVIIGTVTATANGAKTLTLGGTSTQENIITGAIPNSTSATSVTKADAGLWALSGTNTYTGNTSVTGGTLRLKAVAAASTIVVDTSAIVFNANATTQFAGGILELLGANNLASAETVGALTPTAGAGTVKTTATGSGSAALTFASLGTRGAGATINYTPGASTTISFTTLPVVTNGIIAAASGGAAYQTVNGVNWAALSGSSVIAYSGYTTTLPASPVSSTNYALNANASTSGAASVNTLKLIGGGANPTITLGGTLTLTAKSVLFDNSLGTGLITGGQLGTTNVETVIITNGSVAGNALTVASPIGSGTGSLTKSGTGTLIISGNNSYTGNTIINEGTVRMSGATATLGVITTAANATSLRQGATLDLNGAGAGGVITIGGLNGAGTVTNSGGGVGTASTLAIGTSVTTTAGTFSGILQDGVGVGAGILNVTKDGTAAQTLSGLNTYTGVTTIGTTAIITANTLANIGSPSSIGSGQAGSNAASLVFTGTTAGINYTGTTAVSTDRLFTFNGSVANSGAQIANGSANNAPVVFSNTGALAFGAGATVAQTLILGGTSTGDSFFFPQINDNGGLRTSVSKTGVGVWILGNGANGYTGTTTITAGLLGASSTSLPAGSPLVLGGGQFLSSGTFTRNVVTAVTPGNLDEVNWSAAGGFAAAEAKLIVAMGGTGSPTALTWGANGFVPTGNLVLGAASALSELEWRNPIDLNGAARTIQVDDNALTAGDFVTMTGVISNGTGSASLTKSGTGVLQLFGQNTYAGTTAVLAGTLVVNSLGNSSGPVVGTSVGTSAGANTNAITLGNATTTGGVLQYVGPGETSDRLIRLNTTTGANTISADGSGPLILTNVLNDMVAGTKTLQLRGSNTEGNQITSILADNVAGTNTLAILVDSGATWILSGANTFSGAIDVTAGALGVGDASALGTGTLRVRNGSLFAYGDDRTITNPLADTSTTTAIVSAFIGDYSLNLTQNWTHTNTTVGQTITNGIATGKTLTLGGDLQFDSLTGNVTVTFNGAGDTVFNGKISTTTANNVGLTYSGTGSLTLAGVSPVMNAGAVTISSGTVKLGASGVIPDGATAGNVTMSPAVGVTATLDLNGQNETINGLTGTSAGTMVITNSSASAATLTVGGNNQTVAYNGSITRTGNLTLGKTGTGVATFTGPVNITGVNVGAGTLKLNDPLGMSGTVAAGITSVTVDAGGILNLYDGFGVPMTNITTLSLGGGALAGTAQTILELEAGGTGGVGVTAGIDALVTPNAAVVNAATTAGQIVLNVRDAGLSPSTSYTLISAPVGGLLNGGAVNYYALGALGGYAGSTITQTDTSVILNVGTAVLGSMYWTGNSDAKWNTIDGSFNGLNWSSTKNGLTLSTTVPGAGTTVVFQADSAPAAPTGQFRATTLEQSFRINDLIVETSANTLNSLSIGPGAVSTNRLTIQPSLATDGIKINTGTVQGMLISAQVSAGSNQTWNVADFTSVPLTGGATDFAPTPVPAVTVASTTGLVPGMQVVGPGIPTGAYIVSVDSATQFTMSANSTGENATLQSYTAISALTLSGGLTGSGNITKTGSGRVVLSGAGNTYTGTSVTINGGILETQNVTALGGVAATPNTGATVTVSSGAEFRHNSATAGTIANPLVLNGGMLSSGGFTSNATTLALTAVNHTYSGGINVAADSTIHLADLATSTTLGHTMTLSGAISGTSKITLDSVPTVSSGNQITGTLTINNAASTWNGPLALNRGTVVFTNVAGSGNVTPYVAYDGAINFNAFGRIIFRNIDGGTLNRTAAINYAAGAFGELQVDNLGALASNYTVNQNGAVNLNAGSIVRLNTADAASALNFNGGIVLNGNASITAIGGDADSLVSINTIGISGTGDLAINDEAGVWAQTSTRVAINAAGSYTGNTSLNEGTLIIGHKNALSGGTFTVTGASTLQGGVDLSGANAFPNATTLSANLTTSGTNNITFGNTVTQSGGDRTLTNSLTSPAALVLTTLRLAESGSAAARNLTISGTSSTTVNSVVNNDQNNTLTNNATLPATLSIGTIAISDTAATGRTITLGGTGTTVVTGLIENIAGGGGLAGALNKTGTGILTLQGANTFTGDVTATAGTIEFSTVTDSGGAASNLGQGANINLAGGTLSFIGSTPQSTNRPMPLTASSTLAANGTGGATITYSGAINGGATSLTLDGSGAGILNSVLTQTGTGNDINKNGTGTWTLGATNMIADDINVNAGVLNINASQNFLNTATTASNHIVVTGTTAVVNLNAANSHLGDDLFIRSGATVNLGINGALARESAARGTDGMRNMLIGDSGTTDLSTLDLKGFSAATGTITIGTDTIPGQIIDSVGGGNINSTGVTVRLGSASGTISGTATFAKNGAGLFTLSGNNTFTGATTVTEGTLLLDYATNNGSKIASAAGVTIGGTVTDVNPTLQLNGNASAPTTQAFTTLTLNQASSNVIITSNGGQAANLNFTTITRNAGATVDLTLPAVGAVTTTHALTNGIVGGYFTVNNGAAFATKDGSNVIQPLAATTKSDVTTWTLTDNVTDGGAGFTGTVTGITGVNSITYAGAAASANSAGIIGLNSGGILVTAASTGSSLNGGSLTSGLFDVVVHQYAAGDFTLGSSIRGINAITKTGTGALVLAGNNTSSGTVNVTEGLITVTGGKAIGDSAAINFKDVAGSGLQLLANETIGAISGGGTNGGNISLASNTLTVNQSTAGTFSGKLSGNGALVKQGTANLQFATSSNSGFIGSIVVNQGLLYGSGSGIANFPGVTGVTVNTSGAFLVDNNGATTIPDRVNNAATVTLSSYGNGSFFGVHLRSDQDASTTETVGTLFLQGSATAIGVNQNGGTSRTSNLTFASLSRQNNATIFIDGKNLAATTGDNRGRVVFTLAPALTGGTGVAGGTATNVPIVRYAVTLQNTSNISVNDVPNTFAYYGANGVTPLNLANEYKLDAAGYAASVDANDNLRFTTGAATLASGSFNAIVFDSSAASMTVSGAGGGTNTLTVGSGAMLFTSTALANGTTLDTFDALTPGTNASNEWIITAANTTATINSVLTNGAAATALTKSGTGTLILGGTNIYTGATNFNQGIVRASTLANLGNGGALIFYGGTLQFGGVFDPSSRAITFSPLGGGGTFDTNGNDIVVASAVGSASAGSFTKTGAGNLTLNAAMTHTGGTTVANGTLTAGIANIVPATSNLTVNGASAILDVGTFNQTVNTFTLGSGTVTGAAIITASDYQLQSGTVNAGIVLAGASASVGITKTTAGTVTLSGAHTFTGPVAIQAGFLSVDQIADPNGTPSSLGAQTNAVDGALQIGLGANAAGITYTGAGQTANRQIALTGTTGTAAIASSGTGALEWAGAVTSVEFGAKTLVLRGTSASGIVNKLTAGITETLGSVGIQKLDSNLWQIDTASNYTGPTQIDDGTLRIGADNILPSTTAVRLGNTTTAGVFDLNGFNQTIGSLTSSTNSTTATNQILVAAGKTLTINGAVTLGVNAATSTTLVTATGGGSVVVNNSGGTFQVGGATGGTNANTATVDFSGLANFTASLGTTGTFRVGDVTTGTTAAPSTMKLATSNVITAGSIRIGDSSGPSSVDTLTLGSGTNSLNADLINIGSAGTGIRSSGLVNFAPSDTTGTVTIRAADGTSGSTLNMVNTTGSTAGNIDSTINLAGHTADLKFTAVNMAVRSTNTGAASATLTFDQGSMEITALALASRTGAGTGSANGVVNLGDSAAPGSPTTNIGSMTMAVNTSAGGPVTADFNVTGGNVNIGAINMANAVASRTATATIDLTGGTTTVTGNITRTGGAGTESATVTVDGGTLDMSGNSIGTSTAAVSLVAASGKLKNLGELNGGGAFAKTTTGTLTLEGVNTYSGNTTVSAGTLVVNNSSGSGTGSGSVTVDVGTTLAGNGAIAPASGKSITLNGTTVIGTPGSSSAEDFVMTVTGAANIALNGTMRIDLFNNANTGTLNGPTANDLLAVNAADWSALVFGGSSILKIDSILPSNGYMQGDAWKIFDWSGIAAGTAPSVGSGGFASFDLPTLDSGYSWNTTQLYSQGVISIDVVPEPGRALLALFGLLALAFRRRRKA